MMLYLAYGSNLYSRRLTERVPSAVKVCEVELPGYRLCFHKKGADRSAKCNIQKHAGSAAHAIVYRIKEEEKADLDRIEGAGYEVTDIRVGYQDQSLDAYTYLASDSYIDDSIKPYHWYKQLVIAGAEEHNFPQPYIEKIKRVESVRDPDRKRLQKARNILE